MMKKLIFTLGAIFLANAFVFAQDKELQDGNSLIEAYVSPLAYGLGTALNNGWYNTAKPHHFGGFDVTLTTNLLLVPTEAKTFNISDANGTTFSGGNTATILGSTSGGKNASSSYGNIEMPGGLNLPIVPMPVLQVGVGLIKNTEIDVRFLPELDLKGLSTGFFGIGVKHDILQWLPIVDKIPIDLSVQAGYTKLSAAFEIEDPSKTISPKANMDLTATTINLLLSKKILMFTPYVGIGYNATKTTFNVDGEYEIAGYKISANDLTEVEFESNNTLRANLGFRFQIAVLALQANYTFSEYPVATIGAGISIR